MPVTKNKLAHELAYALNDIENLSVYKVFVEKYTETFLRDKFNKAMAVPDHKIRKTRGALFTYLVQQHANPQNNSRD